MKPTNHTNTNIKRYQPETPKTRSFMVTHPVTQEYLKELAQKLILWADELTEHQPIAAFAYMQNTTPSTFSKWTRKCPELKQAHTYAKHVLEWKLAQDCLYKRADAKFAVNFILPLYGNYWRKQQQEVAAIQAEATEQAKAIHNTGKEVHIHMDKIEELTEST